MAWSGPKNELEFDGQIQIPPMCTPPHAEPGQGWVGWNGTVRMVARSWTPDGQMRVRRTSVVSSGPLTDRTKAEDRVESGVFFGLWLTSSEYALIANGEATTARTSRRRPVSERWADPEEIIVVCSCHNSHGQHGHPERRPEKPNKQICGSRFGKRLGRLAMKTAGLM